VLCICEDDYINIINNYDTQNVIKNKFLLEHVPRLISIVSSCYQNYLIFKFEEYRFIKDDYVLIEGE